MVEIVKGLTETLSAQHSQLSLEKNRIESEMSDLCLALEKVDKRIHLIEELMREMSILPNSTDQDSAAANTINLEELESTGARRNGDITELAYSILFERGREPMHYRDLAKAVLEHGGKIGGMDPAQTLVSRIAGDERFIRPAKRGCYSLKVYHPRAKSVGARRRGDQKPRERQRRVARKATA